MREAWLDALHLLDSSFPTGGFAHSFGLETLAPGDLTQLRAVLALRVRGSLACFELVFLLHAYAAADLVDLDEQLDSMLLVREARQASAALGTHLLRAACDLFDRIRLRQFLVEGRHHHHPVAFGAVAAALDLPRELAAEAYAFASLRGLVSAAQRLGWLGQRDAQRVLHELMPELRAAVERAGRVSITDAGGFAPAWDIASMAHERARARMFAS